MKVDRINFLSNTVIDTVINNIVELLLGSDFPHKYEIKHKAWKSNHGGRLWSCNSLIEALKSYWWFGSFEENSEKLKKLEGDIKEAIDLGSEELVFLACTKILDWGQVYRGCLTHLIDKYEKRELIMTLLYGKEIIDGEAPDVSSFVGSPLRMDSGMTKIYSLICEESIIFDDRVASALTLIAAKSIKGEGDRLALRKLKAFGHGDSKKQRHPEDQGDRRFLSNPINGKNHALLNIHSNWILNDAIDRALAKDRSTVVKLWGVDISSDTKKYDSEYRTLRRKIEASLFMLGSDIRG